MLNRLIRSKQDFRRLRNLPWSAKAYNIVNALVGETFGARSIGTLGFRLVEVSLTDRCQCDCLHCYAMKPIKVPEHQELSTDEIKSLVDQIVAMHGTEICFTGGEPLLRDDLPALVRYASQKGLVTKLNTNGILLSEERILELKHSGINVCAISIDSPNRIEHDEWRKYPGCHEKAVNSLRLLNKHDIPSYILAYAKKDRVYSKDLSETVALGHELNVTKVRINFPVPMGGFKNKYSEVLSLEEREEVRRLLEDPLVSLESPREETKCTAGVAKIHVLTNGDVSPCVFVPLVYGNIRKQSLKEIWQAMMDFDRMHKTKGQCPMCDPLFRSKFKLSQEA